jgi:peroxiredoxin
MVEVGQNAPEVQFVDTDRKPVKVSDFKGKTTVLLFFPGAFTGVCTKEMCNFRDNLANYNKLNANVVGISVDSPFTDKAFKESNQLTFPILSDYNRDGVKAFGVDLPNFAGLNGYTAAKRAVFVLDKNGTVRFKWVSDNPGVEPDYATVAKETEKAAA